MVGRNVYISVFLTGLVFAFLSQIVNPQSSLSITLIYFTFVAILLIKLVDEWRYYRSYNAPLASAIFISIPALIAIGGSLTAFTATLDDTENILHATFIELDLNLNLFQLDSFYLFLNLFSLIFCLPFFAILGILIRRYYSGTYPNIFIFRRRFPSESIIVLNASFLVIFTIFWLDQKTIELSSLFFLLFSILTFFQNYILKFVIIPFRRVSRTSTRDFQSQRRAVRSSRTSVETRRSTPQPSRVTQVQERASRSPQRSNVQVAPPIHMPKRTKRKLTPALIASLTPAGQNISKDDFRCIYCYEFPTESDKQVVICPRCKHPSHADEFQKWLLVSNICSRCNKPINNVKMIRISGPSYQKIIQMFQKKYRK
ncbi:hypothetical protein CEE45_13800 [Candidatus Heimdallarchaeota archaeon B3_Heim]|nr:MAG: hypothetical protein CEE45_13800 [Candidatus Heimdallarchaeota archaeon B3_Heim]